MMWDVDNPMWNDDADEIEADNSDSCEPENPEND